MKTLVRKDTNSVTTRKHRKKMSGLAEQISELPGAVRGNIPGSLKHSFADGMYVREITMPTGMVIVSKIHKKTHPYFILSGDVSILTEEGEVRVVGPFHGITKAGTQRALYIHSETVWVTVHATKSRDIDAIEKAIVFKSTDAFDKARRRLK